MCTIAWSSVCRVEINHMISWIWGFELMGAIKPVQLQLLLEGKEKVQMEALSLIMK